MTPVEQSPQSSQARPVAKSVVPTMSGRVSDYANVFTAAQRKVLEDRLAAYGRETTHQIAIPTMPSLSWAAQASSMAFLLQSPLRNGRYALSSAMELVWVWPVSLKSAAPTR